MKKIINVTVLILLSCITLFAAETNVETAGVERYAIYIGSNYGGKGKDKLLYAGTDAQSFQKTMSEIGGIAEKNSCLLIDPSKNDVDMALDFVTAQIEKNKFSTKRSEFIFYYSGHSDENALLLGDNTYKYSELKSAITEVPSDVHVVILDSCYSGNFIRTKGGKKKKPFLFDDTSVVKGHAYLSSSSELESSQESDEIESSFFTNAVITGLRGAADTSGDNKVTLNELYSYAFNETLAKTEGTKAGPQHPNYNITLVGSGDLILSDISTSDTLLSIAKEAEGRFIIRDVNGKLVSEISKNRGQEISMALPAGNYSVVLINGEETKQGEFSLAKDKVFVLDESLVQKVETKKHKLRGGDSEEDENESDVEEEVAEEVVESETGEEIAKVEEEIIDEDETVKKSTREFKFERVSTNKKTYKFYSYAGIFPDADWKDKDFDVNFALGLVGNYTPIIKGIQLSGLINYAQQMDGMQISSLYNGAQRMHGMQISSGINYSGDMKGTQISAIGNFAKESRGLQLSAIYNGTNLNKGLQIGIINYAEKNEGLSIGLINICKEGLLNFSIHYDNDEIYSYEFACGNNNFYTIYGFAANQNYVLGNIALENAVSSLYIGLGNCHPFTPTSSFYFASEIFFKTAFQGENITKYNLEDNLTFSYRFTLNKDFRILLNGFTIFAGAELGWGKKNNASSSYTHNWTWNYDIDTINIENYINLFFGVKFGFHNG